MLHKHGSNLIYFQKTQMQINSNFRKWNYILREQHKLLQDRIIIWYKLLSFILFFIEYICIHRFYIFL